MDGTILVIGQKVRDLTIGPRGLKFIFHLLQLFAFLLVQLILS